MAERMVSMRGGLRFDLQHKKKRQANKGFAVSSSYVKEPLGQLTRLRQGAGKPDGQAYTFWQGNAYLTMPEGVTAHLKSPRASVGHRPGQP